VFPRMTHVALHVSDMAACVAFYQRYCGMVVSHSRDDAGLSVTWLAEPGRETDFIFVLISGGQDQRPAEQDLRHFGFAVASRAAVDAIARDAEAEGCLTWPPVDEPYPVGYYCGLKDPNGNLVEFSYGQPLGPGAEPVEPQA